MTREEVYNSCLQKIGISNCLILQAATGLGKSKISIDLINHLCSSLYEGKKTSMLLLVAKNVHKQTWRDEFSKWRGIHVDNITVECYESLKKHLNETFTFVLMDEVHHVKSDIRMKYLSTLHYDYMIGLSATIPRNLQFYFKHKYKARIVSCDIVEAIEDDVLPEPKILLLPLQLDNTNPTEEYVINPKGKGEIHVPYKERWQYKKQKIRKVIVHCTPYQRHLEWCSLIDWEKNRYLSSHNPVLEKVWLHHCGQRLEFLAKCKIPIVKEILKILKNYRTITFCKTIEHCEQLGSNCIHSKNSNSTKVYDDFNKKKVKHITAVNILNENANLVDCKYAIFANYSSSEVVMPQRIGRSLRHKSPVIIMPFFKGTREEEIVVKMLKDYDKSYIQIIEFLTQILNK